MKRFAQSSTRKSSADVSPWGTARIQPLEETLPQNVHRANLDGPLAAANTFQEASLRAILSAAKPEAKLSCAFVQKDDRLHTGSCRAVVAAPYHAKCLRWNSQQEDIRGEPQHCKAQRID